MYMLEVKKTLFRLVLGSTLLLTSLYADDKDSMSTPILKRNVDGSVIYPRKEGMYSSYHINKQNIKGFKYGRTPTKNEIKAWDVDVRPDGLGLPEGEGSVVQGDDLYSKNCVMCHGEFGSGGKGYPPLSGGQGTLKNQLLKEGDEPPIRTIGSYWPYATTLFWYIKTAMPFPHPKSLTDSQVYAITAYLLSVNDIEIDGESLDDEFVLNKEKLMKVKMPNRDGFYPVSPDRYDLKEQRAPLAQGTRCMKDCDAPALVRIKYEITGFDPAISTVKDLPKLQMKEENTFGKKVYNKSCIVCHGNKAIGAPLFGNKEAWTNVIAKGINKVYSNAIHGVNAMPPKGGRMDLSDAQMKEVIDYMINSSK